MGRPSANRFWKSSRSSSRATVYRNLLTLAEAGVLVVGASLPPARLDDAGRVVLDEILRYPGLPRRLQQIDLDTRVPPVLPTHFRVNGIDLRMFSMMTTFGTPQDVTTDELRVESFFPADEASAALLRVAAEAAPTR